MTLLHNILALGVAAGILGGCSTINSLTGETDNTVLPGQREDAIPGRAQFPDTTDSTTTAAPAPDKVEEQPVEGSKTGCSPDDPACAPPSADDTFSDPQ